MEKKRLGTQDGRSSGMNLLLYLCFFYFMATQLLGSGTSQTGLANAVNMLLYLIFVPGFFFRAGYCYGNNRRRPEAERRRWLLGQAGRYYAYFFLLAFVNELVHQLLADLSVNIQREYLPIAIFTDILSILRVPSVSAVFFTLALALFAAWVFEAKLWRLADRKKDMLLVGAVCLLCALLRVKGEMYELVAALFGATEQQAVPGVPYFAFFLLGIWFEEKRPGFRWKLALGFGALSAVSLALYRTPLQDLFRVTASFLPVYAIYLASGFVEKLAARYRAARTACATIEPVFGVYALGMFALYKYTSGAAAGHGIALTLILATAMLVMIYLAVPVFRLSCRIYAALSSWMYNKVRHRTAVYFLVYTAAFLFLLFVVFLEFFRTGKTFIVYGDGISQYFPRVIYFSRYIKSLVQGLLSGHFELPMYDFRIGLGAEVSYSLEPLYFLFALFDESHMELAYTFVTLLRFYLAGISASVFFLYFKKGYFTTFLASVVYVLSGFPLYGASMHTNFMIPLIMLPLLILSMEEILQRRRWYLCTIFVAISLYGNYYYLYMNTIAMGIYFVVRFLCQEDKSRRTFGNFLSRGLVISGSYLLGVAMSCLVLVTNFGVYLGSGRSGSVLIKTPSLLYYRVEWLISGFLTFITTANSPGEWMKFGFLPIAMIAVILLFMRKGRKELKIFTVIYCIFTAFPLFGFIFSGFSTILNRWCYMAALVVAYNVADCLPDMYRMKKNEKLVCAAVIAIYTVLSFFGNYKSSGFTQVAALLLLVTFLVLLLTQESQKWFSVYGRKSLMIWLTVAVVFWQGFSLYHIEGFARQFTKYGGSALNMVVNSPLQVVDDEVEDDSFYRVAVPKLEYYHSNAPILLDYNGLTLVNSTYNGNIMEYLEMMGSLSYGPNRLLGMGNCTFMNNLAAVKYYAAGEEPEKTLPYGSEAISETELDGEKVIVYKNKYALPIGYTYRDAISEAELEKHNALERQEVLMQKMVLNGSEDTGKDDAAVTSEELEILSVKESRAYLMEDALIAGSEAEVAKLRGIPDDEMKVDGNDKSYNLTLTFEGKPNSETYLVLENGLLRGDMSENPIHLVVKTEKNSLGYDFNSDDYRYNTGQKDFVFNLGYHKEAITSCEIRMGRQGKIEFDSLKLYSQPMDSLEQYTSELSENVLENVEVGTNRVSGTISLEEDKYLLLSIPYQRGWTALVDGEKVKLERANYMYMALPLTAGEHTVELTFAIPGISYAFLITGASAVLFLLLCFLTWRKSLKKAGRDKAALQEGRG